MQFSLSHAAIVHVPLGLAVVMPLLAGALTLAIWRRRLPRSAFAIVTVLQLAVVGAGLLAIRLGNADAETTEQVAPEQAVDAHEDAAEAFVWIAAGVLVAAAVALVVPARRVPAMGALVTAGALAAAALGVSAGAKGGQLVHGDGVGVPRLAASSATAAAPAKHGRGHQDDD